ncbi:hypothetical protein GCM10010340_50660 [Streptomyces griseoloalbus]|nr:hypothetical protein GCM10010340_50660 [Streptomyces albaduncus]
MSSPRKHLEGAQAVPGARHPWAKRAGLRRWGRDSPTRPPDPVGRDGTPAAPPRTPEPPGHPPGPGGRKAPAFGSAPDPAGGSAPQPLPLDSPKTPKGPPAPRMAGGPFGEAVT